MEEFDRRTLENIEKFGCSVLHIAEEEEFPPFSYSVGITKTSSAPEFVVVGLKQEICHFIINGYYRRVRSGESFEPGQRYSGFIEGFEVQAQKVEPSFYKEYFGYNLCLYDGSNFEILQFVYPNTSGVWPCAEEADEWFKSRQPILSAKLSPRSAL